VLQPQTKHRDVAEPSIEGVTAKAAPDYPRVAQDFDEGSPSPATALLDKVRVSLNPLDVEDDGRRWAPRATLLFGGAVSIALWTAIAAAILEITH
jgi:hypothetical protein